MRNIDVEAERQFENGKVEGSISRAAQDKFYEATRLDESNFQDFFVKAGFKKCTRNWVHLWS